MTGREEADALKEAKVLEKLKGWPDYMTNYYYSLTDKAVSTRDNYVYKIQKFLTYLKEERNMDISDPYGFDKIKPSEIEIFISRVSGKAQQKRQFFYAIKTFFAFLEKDLYIKNDPTAKIKPVKDTSQHEIVSLTNEEIETIFHTLDNPPGDEKTVKWRSMLKTEYKLYWSMSIMTGLRKSSMIQMNLEDIDFKNRMIVTRQKGNYVHNAYYDESVEKLLNRWLAEREKILNDLDVKTNALFINKWGERITASNLQVMFAWSTSELEKHVSPHKTRSTCATHILDATGDIALAAEILGHANIRNTMRYIKKDEKRAANKALGVLGSEFNFK